jgi:hypothetical protein
MPQALELLVLQERQDLLVLLAEREELGLKARKVFKGLRGFRARRAFKDLLDLLAL